LDAGLRLNLQAINREDEMLTITGGCQWCGMSEPEMSRESTEREN
jgi:hypothetical protein